MKTPNYLLFLLVVLSIIACRSKKEENQDYTPKPKGYNRIDLPNPAYQTMDDSRPYSFEFSKYAIIKPDSFARAEPYWIYIDYPSFDANVQITYKPIKGNLRNLQLMINDARKLSYKHNVKAFSITEKQYTAPNGNKANITDLEGEVPSQVQFFMTDSSKHFLRGALYFKTSTQNDSLAPVIQYIRNDIIRMVNTMQWR
jgi:gliding motility-associated lipoprotein GldD